MYRQFMGDVDAPNPQAIERRSILLVAVFFAACTALFAYPISTAPNSYLNDLGDVRLAAWTLAWNAHALVTNPFEILDPNIYFPHRGALAWSEMFLTPSLLVAPINWAGYPVLAYNLVLLSSFVLCGLGAALWVRRLTGSWGAGIIAGFIWAFAPGKLSRIAHLHMMLGQWVPFALYFCTRYLESGRARDLYALSVMVGLQFGFSLHYGVFLLPLLGMYGLLLWRLLPVALPRDQPTLPRHALVAATLAVLLAVPAALPVIWANQNVGLQRSYEELLRYSARPGSFLSASLHNQAPHVRWLYDRLFAVEANYFPGVVPLLLAGVALSGLLRVRRRAMRSDDRMADRRIRGSAGILPGIRISGATTRWGVAFASALTTIAALALHGAGMLSAAVAVPGRPTRLMRWCVEWDPALWAAVAPTVALLILPSSSVRQLPRRTVYVIVLGYLTLVTYLLAYGPEVQAFDATLGRGPYWLLYQYLLPFRLIRAAGRIGILWILCIAALAGFAFAGFEQRWTRANGDVAARRTGRVPVLLLIVVLGALVWEFRAWPLRHEPVDPAADPADVWLAEQPGNFGVVHVPIRTGRFAGRETRYMLGSTLHWKRLVNGYARFVPDAYRQLSATVPLSPEFFDRLRAGFPVRYVLAHEELLEEAAHHEQLRRVIVPNLDAQLVGRLGYTFVFAMGDGSDTGGAATEPGTFRLREQRRYSTDRLRDVGGLAFSARSGSLSDSEDIVLLAGWGEQREALPLSRTWAELRVELPDDEAREGSQASTTFTARPHVLMPVGETGVVAVTGFTVDAQHDGTAVGIHERLLYADEEPGLVGHLLEAHGKGVAESRAFPVTRRGAAGLLGYIEALPVDALVAVSVNLPSLRTLDQPVVDALRLIGAAPPPGEEVRLVAALGVRGAEPGSAMWQVHHDHAFIDVEGPTAVFALRDLRPY